MVEVKGYRFSDGCYNYIDEIYEDFTRLLFAKDMPTNEIKTVFAQVCAEELQSHYIKSNYRSIKRFIENEFSFMEESIYQIYE